MANLTGKTIGQLALLTGITQDTLFAVELSGATYHIPYSGLSTGGGSYEEVTYSELRALYTGGTLTPGGYYLMTDFQSIYDQPDFDINNNPIITGNSKTGITEPLLIFATSSDSLSTEAESILFPNDKISYDITFSTTEISNTPAKGRITERIDEYNNRTDYDSRGILFKRYRLYTIRQQLPLNGEIELQSDGTVLGQNTTFTGLSVGDVIYIENNNQYYEITGITDNTTMGVSGDSINAFGCCGRFFLGIEETNGTNGYFSYKRPNIKSDDFVEYTTFGDAISENYVKNTYIGDYANNFTENGVFILSNNVFLEGQYENNTFGNYCFNNTFGTDNQNNVFGTYCAMNVSTNDIDENIIGNGFQGNIINTNLVGNIIGNDFNFNLLLGENGGDFRNNTIGNNFNSNTIYSDFYENEISYGFENNLIGDYGNLDNFSVYRNKFSNRFFGNTIRTSFFRNILDINCNNNQFNGEFYQNELGGSSYNNQFGYDIYSNKFGGYCNNNTISEYFYFNKLGESFENNRTSYNFNRNDIGNNCYGNRFGDLNKWSWYDLNNVSGRTYDTFVDALDGGGVGNKVMGKELVMWDTVSNEYHKVKFFQWTQGGNGGGFAYTRQLIYPTSGPEITFVRRNYSDDVDVIVPGVLEITRENYAGQIYNAAVESGYNGNSPGGTLWNSEYTASESGYDFIQNKIGNYFSNNVIYQRFGYNTIGNNFYNNDIFSDFGYGGGNDYGNQIYDDFNNNTIDEYCYNNVFGNNFYNNTLGHNFQWNVISTNISNINFRTYQKAITGFTYLALGTSATDGTYTNLTGTTNAQGVNATFDVVVSSSAVTSVTIVNQGNEYDINDSITILGSQIGGVDVVDDIAILVTQIIEPSVYQSYSCQLFQRQGGDKRLSYYDSSDVLTITNVNL